MFIEELRGDFDRDLFIYTVPHPAAKGLAEPPAIHFLPDILALKTRFMGASFLWETPYLA